MRPHLRGQRRLALFIGLAAIVSACGSATASVIPTPEPSANPALSAAASNGASPSGGTAGTPNPADQALFATIQGQVEALRELKAQGAVSPVLLDSKALADNLAQINASQTNHEALANESRLFIHLGLLPAGSSLEQMELDLEAGQVVGFYDPKSKGLFVLSGSGGVGPVEKITFSHEYTHALQDQNFGLDKLATDTPDQGDRDLARTALPEGDATLLMTLWATKNLSAIDLLAVAGDSSSAAQAAQLASAPAILRQTLLFPYDQGLAFVQGIYSKGGWAAVDKVYANPPDSTSQIIHPELYAAGVKPVAVSVPAVPATLNGWKLVMQDTLGEQQLGIWLEGEDASESNANAAMAGVNGWGGDRAGLYEGPDGSWAVVVHTTWRLPAAAQSFTDLATQRLAAIGGQYRICGDSTNVNVAIASSEALVPDFIACNTMG